MEAFFLLIVNGNTGNVGGQKVVGELDAFEFQMKRVGQAMGQWGLADTGNILNEQVSPGEKAGDCKFDGFAFPKNDLLNIFLSRLTFSCTEFIFATLSVLSKLF